MFSNKQPQKQASDFLTSVNCFVLIWWLDKAQGNSTSHCGVGLNSYFTLDGNFGSCNFDLAPNIFLSGALLKKRQSWPQSDHNYYTTT